LANELPHIFPCHLREQNHHGLYGWSFNRVSLPCSSVPMRRLGRILSQSESEGMEV